MKLISVKLIPIFIDATYVLKNAGVYRAVSCLSDKRPYVYESDGKGTVRHGSLDYPSLRSTWEKGKEKYYGNAEFVLWSPWVNPVSPKTPKKPTKYQVAKAALAEWTKGYADGSYHSPVVENVKIMLDEWGPSGYYTRSGRVDEKNLWNAYKTLDARDKVRFREHAAREGKRIGK